MRDNVDFDFDLKFHFDEVFNHTLGSYEDKKFYNVTKIRLGSFHNRDHFFVNMTFSFFDNAHFTINETMDGQGWVEVVPPNLTISNYIRIEGHIDEFELTNAGFSEMEIFGNKEGIS